MFTPNNLHMPAITNRLYRRIIMMIQQRAMVSILHIDKDFFQQQTRQTNGWSCQSVANWTHHSSNWYYILVCFDGSQRKPITLTKSTDSMQPNLSRRIQVEYRCVHCNRRWIETKGLYQQVTSQCRCCFRFVSPSSWQFIQ